MPVKEFVERREAGLYLIDSRVPLATIVWEFQRGESPESIRSHYPTLSLEQINGAIVFYLGNKEEAERDLAESEQAERDFDARHPFPAHLREKLENARKALLSRQA